MGASEEVSQLTTRLNGYGAGELRDAVSYLESLRRFKQGYEITVERGRELVETAAQALGFEITSDTLNARVLGEVVDRYNRDIERLMVISLPKGVDAFEQAGYLTFWIRKLKPVIDPTKDDGHWRRINEVLAFTIGFCVLKSVYPGNIVGWGEKKEERDGNFESFVKDFTYHLRYGPASPAMISQIYYGIWVLMRGH
jgi:hypothetical protein